VAQTVAWLKEECGLDDAGAEQAIEYVLQGERFWGMCQPRTRSSPSAFSTKAAECN